MSGFALAETRMSLSAASGGCRRVSARPSACGSAMSCCQVEIAEQLGCSQMQVSRLLRRAAGRLREDGAMSA